MPNSETPTEVLARAASLMRERAKAATPGPWTATDRYPHVVMQPDGESMVSTNLAALPAADAAHIAGWHPAVALAVAEWLDLAADRWAANGHVMTGHAALSVATAYLADGVTRPNS